MGKQSGRGSARFTRKDAGILATTGFVLIVLSGTCWHFASESKTRFRTYDGVVVSKVSRLPPGKQMYPVGRAVIIEQSDGKRETVTVTEAIYQHARPGMKF